MRIRLICFLLLLGACGHNPEPAAGRPNSSSDFSAAKAAWAMNKSSLGTYYLTLVYSGMTGPVELISAVNNQTATITGCTQASRRWNDSSFTYSSCPIAAGSTVESLFQKIEDGLSTGSPVTAVYDAQYGVPKSIYIRGGSSELADASDGFSASVSFSPLAP